MQDTIGIGLSVIDKKVVRIRSVEEVLCGMVVLYFEKIQIKILSQTHFTPGSDKPR